MRGPDCVQRWNWRTPKTQIDNAGFIPATSFRQAIRGSWPPMMRYRPAFGPSPFGSSLYGKAFLAALGLFPLVLNSVGAIDLRSIGFAVLAPAYAQTRDPIVTSDTPEYCGVLMNRITGITRATTVPPPTEVAVLSEEGERMCVHGQTRGGILRLRRALEIMRHSDD
jgi:hypothetical protein